MGMAGQDGECEDQEEQEGEAADEEGHDDDEVICQPCGEAPIVIAKDPGCPTREEVERHNVTHLPYRSWCPVCVQARGKENRRGRFRRL